jgi:hypothetical protein
VRLPNVERIQDRQLVGGEHPPGVIGAQRPARAAGVPLVHRDDSVLVLERLDRVERHPVPEWDRRVQPTGGQQQEGKTRALPDSS